MSIQDKKTSLAMLADWLPNYYKAIEKQGFSCCHIAEDWFGQHFKEDVLAEHKKYLIEFALEALKSTDPTSIIFSDEENCQSMFLNKLKAIRFQRFGAVNVILDSSTTRHYIELSACLFERSRILESFATQDQMIAADWAATFRQRWVSELKRHQECVDRQIEELGCKGSELELQYFFSGQIAAALSVFEAKNELTLRRNQVLGTDEAICAVVFNLTGELYFVLRPVVVGSLNRGSGKVGMGFRLMTKNAIEAKKFEFARDVVLHLDTLLPNKFIDYGRFADRQDFCLCVLAWTAALKVLIPDVLNAVSCPSVLVL